VLKFIVLEELSLESLDGLEELELLEVLKLIVLEELLLESLEELESLEVL
jgi:hypothetical protein